MQSIDIFNGTLGTWKPYIVDFLLKENSRLICLQPYTITKVKKEGFKKRIKRLVLSRVIKREHDL